VISVLPVSDIHWILIREVLKVWSGQHNNCTSTSTTFGWVKGGNVTSAGWQLTLCDPVLHVSSQSVEVCCELLYSIYLYLFTFTATTITIITITKHVSLCA